MRILGPLWGTIGVCALLSCAIYRLYPRGMEAINGGLTTLQWVILVLWVLFMLVAEGYRGFQKKFSPRTAARVKYLRDKPDILRTIFAPFFCMGYFHANKKTKIIATCLTLGIILLVVLVSFCPQPWRGIIDVGVVLGLTYGMISFLIFTYQALTQSDYPHSPETP
ncbi:MAG: hypothetical protein P1U89_01370 [Verrucomicrobiales bacterium]|nr:hypothetical protein [Verrucomicrobiales bacterium]